MYTPTARPVTALRPLVHRPALLQPAGCLAALAVVVAAAGLGAGVGVGWCVRGCTESEVAKWQQKLISR